jgi:hypothetical protein
MMMMMRWDLPTAVIEVLPVEKFLFFIIPSGTESCAKSVMMYIAKQYYTSTFRTTVDERAFKEKEFISYLPSFCFCCWLVWLVATFYTFLRKTRNKVGWMEWIDGKD